MKVEGPPIRLLKPKIDTLIVMSHWGAEYSLSVSERPRSEAHKMIGAGADMVIGSHPHVVEPVEIYNHKFIAYSLGNYIFDQYFFQDTTQGLRLKLAFRPDEMTIQFIPIATLKQQTQLLTGAPRGRLPQRISAASIVSDAGKRSMRNGLLTIPK